MITRRTAAMAAMTLVSATAGGLIASLSDLQALAQSDRPLSGDRLTITDRQGRVRAGLGLSGGNQEFTYFYMIDRNGRTRVSYSVSDTAAPEVDLGARSAADEGSADRAGGRVVRDHRDARPTGREAAGSRADAPGQADQGQCAAPPASQLRGRIKGTIPGPGAGGKADGSQFLRPPVGNAARDVQDWLSAFNAGLLEIIAARYKGADINLLRSEEAKECSSNVYCRVAFRRNVIAAMSGVQP